MCMASSNPLLWINNGVVGFPCTNCTVLASFRLVLLRTRLPSRLNSGWEIRSRGDTLRMRSFQSGSRGDSHVVCVSLRKFQFIPAVRGCFSLSSFAYRED